MHFTRQHDCENGLKHYSFPFSFVVPSVLEYSHDDKPSLCRMLPPSFDTARQRPSRWNETNRPLLSITYSLVACIHYHENGHSALHHVEVQEPVNYLPYAEVQPPTPIEDFPGEFVFSELIKLRKHALGGHLGAARLSASEPPPLIYSSPISAPSTEFEVFIIIHPISLPLCVLQNLSFDVKPAIRAKTVYSTTPMTCMTKQSDLAEDTLNHVHDDVTKLEERRFSDLEWRQILESGLDDMPTTDEALASSGPQILSGQNGLRGKPNERHGAYDGVWKASITVVIKPPELLVPAFCGSLIARSYSLLLRIRVRGAYGRKCGLELPLRVAHIPHQSMPRCLPEQTSGSCKGPVALLAQEDVSLLQRNLIVR